MQVRLERLKSASSLQPRSAMRVFRAFDVWDITFLRVATAAPKS